MPVKKKPQGPPPPTMQDLSDPRSVVARAFKRMTPPATPFDPNGTWSHTYRDGSTHHPKSVQGELTIQRKPGGRLHIESYRRCPDKYRYYTIADLHCRNDELSTPTSWLVESKIAKTASAPAYLDSGLKKQAEVEDKRLKLREGRNRHAFDLPGRYTCKWCLLDAVQHLPRLGTKQVEFTLIDEYDEVCPKQVLRFRQKAKAQTKAGAIEVMVYDHIGTAVIPGSFYVDANGRLLFYLAGMQILALTEADGKRTGF